MHPITSRPDRAWLVYVAMGIAGAAIAIGPLREAGASDADAGWFALWGVALMGTALGAWPAARYVTVSNAPFQRFIGSTFTIAGVATAVWLGAGKLLADATAGLLPTVGPAFRDAWPSLWWIGVVSMLCMLFLLQALAAADDGETAARRALASDVASRDAELRALRAQVNPHFLFNCLHSISSMTGRDPDGARKMCLELAEFFRSSLKAGAEPRVPLATELALLRRYLDIEQVRFGRRLDARFEEHGDLSGITVPPLLLQPLVENAVRHGIATLVDGGVVRVSAARAGDRVDLVVENAFDPDGRRAGTGVGLANVRERLDAAYRGLASVRAETMAPGAADEETRIFRVSISLPAGAGAQEQT